jgi:hypothetical protein
MSRHEFNKDELIELRNKACECHRKWIEEGCPGPTYMTTCNEEYCELHRSIVQKMNNEK